VNHVASDIARAAGDQDRHAMGALKSSAISWAKSCGTRL
jgi:hypothetical protein